MDKDNPKNKEHLHYTIAWFFGVLIFFFLGGWFLSRKIYIFNVSTNIWGIFLLLYIAANAAYHCYYQIFPYIGERRNLAFVDFFFLSLCIFFQFPIFVVLTLLNIQIVLIVLSMRQENPLPKRFFSFYLVTLIVLCMFMSEPLSHKFVAFIVLFCGEAIFILSFWYGINILLRNNQKIWREQVNELQENRISESFSFSKEIREKEKKSNNNYKKINKNLQQIIQAQQIFLGILKNPLQFKIYQKISENGSKNIENIISKERNKDLLQNDQKEINIYEFLQEAFSYIQNEKEQKNVEVKIHKDENVSAKTFLCLEPLTSWIIHEWALYLLNHYEKEINIYIIEQEESLSLKGCIKLNIKPTDKENIPGCPECKKKVRSLYENHKKQELCLQCHHKLLENELRTHWEDASGPLDAVFLIRKWMLSYQLGSVQCGISSWENYEYFVTLVLTKYEKKQSS